MKTTLQILLIAILIASCRTSSAQMMTLYVVSYRSDFSRAVAKDKISKMYDIMVKVKSPAGTLDFKKFKDALSERKFTVVPEAEFCVDYRVLCVFTYEGKKTKIYLSCLGDFLIDGVSYHDDNIREFVFKHIPPPYLNE